MPCYHPLSVWIIEDKASGKKKVYFKQPAERSWQTVPTEKIPCGRCIGCRLERSRQWALRCVHEAALHEENSFITLTYDNAHLPPGGTLIKKDFQDFMKRLRERIRKREPQRRISYYHCGEYGEKERRPHYHALLFGLAFPDQTFFKKAKDGSSLFVSATLASLWPFGNHLIGAVTFESAAYCARYVLKKMTGNKAAEHYRVTDPDTGELVDLVPEYATMSLNPAIGKRWYEEFGEEVYPDDFVVLRGRKMKPPKYYDQRLATEEPELHAEIKERREAEQKAQKANSTPERLAVREEVKLASMQNMKRDIE